MPTDAEYQKHISKLQWEGLQELWAAIRAGKTPGWDSGKAFEYLILQAFYLDGARIRWPYEVSFNGEVVEQIDGAVYAGNLPCLVEAKDTADVLQADAIAKLRQKLGRRPAGVLGLLFSRSGFTRPASTLAQFLTPQNILLWTGDDVSYALEHRGFVGGLQAKFRHCVEHAVPNHELRRAEFR